MFAGKRFFSFLLAFALCLGFSDWVFAEEKTDMKWRDEYNGVKYNAVSIDLNSDKYEIGVSTGYDGTMESEPFADQIKRNNAIIASNGNFFSSYTAQGTREYYGTVVKKGIYDNKGSLGSIGFNSDNRAIFFEFIEKQRPDFLKEKDIQWAVSGDPIIVKDGKNVTGQFKTTRNDLDNPAARTAMGYTADNKLLIITSRRATIREMGDILLKLGAVNGVNLDGGASSALYYRGETVTPAGRNLNVIFYVKEVKPIEAVKSNSKLLLNDKEVEATAYNIENNNYVQLRDLADLLSDTNSKFDIRWESSDNSISLVKYEEYQKPLDAWEKKTYPENAVAKKSKFVVKLSGEALKLKGYNINGNNYYKLRDLANYLEFEVVWNAEKKQVELSTR